MRKSCRCVGVEWKEEEGVGRVEWEGRVHVVVPYSPRTHC